MATPHPQSWPRWRILFALFAAMALLAIVAAAVWVKERRPAQDLRVSFHTQNTSAANPAMTYVFHNRGSRPAAVRGVGLVAIAGDPAIINPRDNVDLCDKVDPADLKPPGQVTMHGIRIGGAAAEKREQYAPVSLSVGGKPEPPAAAFEIASGQSLTIAATFATDPRQTGGTTNQVFCPVIWLAQAGHGGTAVCQGFATATNRGGVSNTIVARQFRVLPAVPGASCPVAGR